jgi:peptidoglycan/LPS O-acetylase OafA/YrhL
MNQYSKGTEIPVLESLRAFAATSVCLYHFVCTTTDYVHNKSVLSIFSLGEYGVHLFFVISGFIIPWSMYRAGYEIKHFFTFLWKRILRIEPPYLVSVIVASILLLLRLHFYGSTGKGELTGERLLLHLGYLVPFTNDHRLWINQVYWTLAIEFQYYLTMAFLIIPLIKGNLWVRISIYASFIAVSFMLNYAFLPKWLPVFGIGIILFLEYIKRISKIEFWIAIAAMFAIITWRMQFGAILYISLGFIMIYKFKDFNTTVGNFLGHLSYSFYLFHPLIGGTIINVLSHQYNTTFEKIMVFTVGFILTVFGSYIMYLLVEKWSRNMSKKVVYSK